VRAKAANEYQNSERLLPREGTILDWVVTDAEVWDSLYEWWASPEFRARYDRARANLMSKRAVHHYGADGHVRKDQRMV
jgi:hypothetical protein